MSTLLPDQPAPADLGFAMPAERDGHRTPAGNFFTARALRETLVRWLGPAPPPYRPAPLQGIENDF
jgi:hypothetical protein